MKLPKLILASGSPRRAEILSSVGWEFTRQIADIDENELPNEDAAEYVQRLAKEKAFKVAESVEYGLVLGADTTVVIDGRIIGKPLDLGDARRMLRLLSGREHQVFTGIALVSKSEEEFPVSLEKSRIRYRLGIQKTKVKFAAINESEIDFLAENGGPLDKAGAYAVQAQAALFIEEIQGDYWNVVGLPVNLVYSIYRELSAKE